MEIPHFGSMRGKERELIVLRSDNGDTWKEHQFDSRPEDLTELLAGMDEGKRDILQKSEEKSDQTLKNVTHMLLRDYKTDFLSIIILSSIVVQDVSIYFQVMAGIGVNLIA